MKFIEQPDVRVIGHTTFVEGALDHWADAHGFSDAAEDEHSPLYQIIADSERDPYMSIDAMPEFGGRFCYRSFEKGRQRRAYIDNVIEMEHGSVFHHSTINFAISGISRSLSHELVRHHVGCDPSQESQRYVPSSDINFVVPPAIVASSHLAPREVFEQSCHQSLASYTKLLGTLDHDMPEGIKAGTMAKKRALEAARSLLGNAAETRMLWTMNMRAARYLIALRGGEGADLEIRRLAAAFARLLLDYAPLTFAGTEVYMAPDGFEAVRVPHPKI